MLSAAVVAGAAFPLLALSATLAGWLWPVPLAAAAPAIAPLLGLVMLAMGLSLRPGDFTAVARRPGTLALGLALQWLLMPAAGWALASLLALPPALLIGVILVGTAPGGTASNLICYLARGDLALSISLTALSTLFAVITTPLLTALYLGEALAVDRLALLRSVAEVVLLPVLAGMALNRLLGARLGGLLPWLPRLSMLAIALIIAIIVALNQGHLGQLLGAVTLAVVLHNLIGLSGGYGLARLAGQDRRTARTLAIEVGMQNSGLAVALAIKHFGAAAALPGALFSLWHNLSGALLATWWSRPAPAPATARRA